MRLTDLSPEFHRYETGIAHEGHGRHLPDGTIQWGGFNIQTMHNVATLAEAQGVWFYCPKCWKPGMGEADGVGVHLVDVTFAGRGVPDEYGCHGSDGKPTRWNVSGTNFEDLTTTPSILLIGGCAWHGFITEGAIITC